jgi:DNA-binding NarL/FixJ family response regulator
VTASDRDQRCVRVLVVDDHELFRSAAARVVDVADGFETAGSAASGADALIVLAADPTIDLVLADVHMPGLDGPALARRHADGGGGARVVLMSTAAAVDLAPESLAAPVAGFLPKSTLSPSSLADVWARITADPRG